jgi:hypothetical protein
VTGQEALSVLIVLGPLAAYGLVHVRVFGWRPCPRCGGERRLYSAGAHRDCPRCGATGRVRRLGAGKAE